MTYLLSETLKNGYTSQFIDLLEDWGRWARYFGCRSYRANSSSVQPRFIDDETAKAIDKAVCDVGQFWRLLKDTHNRPIDRKETSLGKVFLMHYVQQMDELDIVIVLKNKQPTYKKHRSTRNSYTAQPYEILDGIDADGVLTLIRYGSKLVLEKLKGEWCS